jgi:hypothetical protein
LAGNDQSSPISLEKFTDQIDAPHTHIKH